MKETISIEQLDDTSVESVTVNNRMQVTLELLVDLIKSQNAALAGIWSELKELNKKWS